MILYSAHTDLVPSAKIGLLCNFERSHESFHSGPSIGNQTAIFPEFLATITTLAAAAPYYQ